MNKLIFFLFVLLLAGCQTKEFFIDPIRPEFENVSFDVVQKQLVIEPELPIHVEGLVSQWFEQKVKIDGFDGEMRFVISEYLEEVSSISDGKKVDIFLSFNVILNKPSLSQTQMIEGSVSSFGTLTGNFSLAEFDIVIQNTQSDLILRLSRDLKSKI
ncbi:hypothetical protein N9M26_02710 [Alphaproteobacteria bacterium]|nr:hypothetical protein [Alphaproteobacteria bacterium]